MNLIEAKAAMFNRLMKESMDDGVFNGSGDEDLVDYALSFTQDLDIDPEALEQFKKEMREMATEAVGDEDEDEDEDEEEEE